MSLNDPDPSDTEDMEEDVSEVIEEAVEIKPLQSIQTLQSFNRMVNYLKRFSPVLTELSEPLRRLQEICEATSKDQTLKLLTKIVHEGWPRTIRDWFYSVQSNWYL